LTAVVNKGFFKRLPAAPAPLLYSFEDGPQNFHANGFPLPTVAQDTIGATDGTGSLLFSLSRQENFSGALTLLVDQATLLDPSTESISFDLTIAPGDEYTGAGFARLGIMFFGSIPSQNVFGIPVQTNGPSERDVKLPAGTYHMTVPLISTAGTPMRDAFGTGADKLEVVSGFEFYVNKTNDDDLTVYIDNVRAVPGPFAGEATPPATAAAPAAMTGAESRPAARPARRSILEDAPTAAATAMFRPPQG
jgi:hypothetical protein